MRALLSVPANKNAIAKLPLVAPAAGAAPFDPPFIADAWNGPIIYVPAGGLSGVKVQDATSAAVTITSTGVTSNPQNRPFFASAGPDGDFTKGDDNVYSFQK
jgi:hypothetical protein